MLDLVTLGAPVPADALPELTWERDLQCWEGPLLVTCRGQNGDLFLLHWCDQDERATRWLVLPVDELTVDALLAQRLTMHQVILESFLLCSPRVLLLDHMRTGQRSAVLVGTGETAGDWASALRAYLPAPGVYLLPELAP
jgi:hypothetical protein